MPQPEIEQYLSYMPGLNFLLTLHGHYDKPWVRIFYASVWTDPDHEFIRYMFKGDAQQLLRADLDMLLKCRDENVSLHELLLLDALYLAVL